MPRRARVVVPHIPHHLTQRGVRRRQVFFEPSDYQRYRDLLHAWTERAGVQILCYCLMPNHVHIAAVAETGDAFARALGGANSQYARIMNRREHWTGHLWQARFYSCAVDEPGTRALARYILLNPVRAGLVQTPEAWPYSSIHAHLRRREDPLVEDATLRAQIEDWASFLADRDKEADENIRNCTWRRTPYGSPAFVDDLERRTGQRLRWRRRGRPRKRAAARGRDG